MGSTLIFTNFVGLYPTYKHIKFEANWCIGLGELHNGILHDDIII